MGSEDFVRMVSYFSVLAIMASWELLAPTRAPPVLKLCRWGGNLTIVILNMALARLFFVGGVATAASMAKARG